METGIGTWCSFYVIMILNNVKTTLLLALISRQCDSLIFYTLSMYAIYVWGWGSTFET